ncbi:MAG: hypothetical protein KKF33_02255 [Alphaproteobacteria bacterium]|nr:hypothetical protein [Alphaproteobacteria bacterium]
MKMLKIVALTATLIAGVSAASASPYSNMGSIEALNAIQDATGATVLSLNSNEAISLMADNDAATVQARIQNNKWLVDTIERQGYTVDQIIGATGDRNSLTLYAL